MLLDKPDDGERRGWYAEQAVDHGWSRNVLLNQIMSQLHRRLGAAPSNFLRTLPGSESKLVQQIIKGPYNLELLGDALPGASDSRARATREVKTLPRSRPRQDLSRCSPDSGPASHFHKSNLIS